MTKASSGRLLAMDGAKLAAAVFVVFIHSNFAGNSGVAVKAIARFAVPFFFLCSGYFLYGSRPEKVLRKLAHVAGIYVTSLLMYFAFDCAKAIAEGGLQAAAVRIVDSFRPNVLIKWLFWNVQAHSGHLWYLHAMIYVYAIYWWLARRKASDRFVLYSAAALLALHLVIWHAVCVIKPEATQSATFIVRNFLLEGYPLVGLGMMVKKHHVSLPKVKAPVLCVALLSGAALSVASRFAFGNKSVPAGALIMAFALLLYTIQTQPASKGKWLEKAGVYSTYLYILHPMIITIVYHAAKFVGLPTKSVLWINVQPLVICMLSIAVSTIAIPVHHWMMKWPILRKLNQT
ncbi:MAG: acyltransferase [Clostridia bacterium]|nr:acyltransferase [Clostridia bacterium]